MVEGWKPCCYGLNNMFIHTAAAAPSAFGISPKGGDK